MQSTATLIVCGLYLLCVGWCCTLQGPATASSPALTVQQRHWLLVTLVTAAGYGLVRLVDLVTHLVIQPLAGSLQPPVAAHVLLVLLGPGGVGGTGQTQVPGPRANPGVSWWLQQQQAQLAPTLAAAAVADVLLSAVLSGLQQERAVPPVVKPWVDLVNSQSEVNPHAMAVSTAVSLVNHAPLRYCLLSDLQAAAAVLLARPGSTLVKALPGALTPWALPQRLVVQGLVSGRLHVLTPHRVVVVVQTSATGVQPTAAASAATSTHVCGGMSSPVLGSAAAAVQAAATALVQQHTLSPPLAGAGAAAAWGGGPEAAAPAAAAADQMYQAGWLLGVVGLLGSTCPRALPAVQAVLELMVREQQYRQAVQVSGGATWLKVRGLQGVWGCCRVALQIFTAAGCCPLMH
jgi:hypothetical protein